MSERKKDFLLNLAAGGVLAVVMLIIELARGRDILTSLCNCFSVPAVFLLGIGGIKGIRNKGAFDVMGFGLKSTVETFIPMLRKNEKETFMDYRERKESSRRSSRGLLLAGAVYLAISVVLLIVYEFVN